MRASAKLSKSRALLIEACTMIRSSRVKPLRSSAETSHWVHLLNQECPATSSSRDTLFHTLSILSGQGSSWTAVQAEYFIGFVFSQRKNHSSHMLDQCDNATRSSINNSALPCRAGSASVSRGHPVLVCETFFWIRRQPRIVCKCSTQFLDSK